jgi:transcriptional regulator with XRE-family HTH domain
MPRVPKQTLPPLKLSSESLGQRIARIRKLRGLTQVQLAQKIGIERTVIANYEKDRLRIYDEMLARIALALSVSTDELLGLSASTPSKDEAASLRLVRRLRKIEQLPPAKQKAIIQTLDMALQSFEQERSE